MFIRDKKLEWTAVFYRCLRSLPVNKKPQPVAIRPPLLRPKTAPQPTTITSIPVLRLISRQLMVVPVKAREDANPSLRASNSALTWTCQMRRSGGHSCKRLANCQYSVEWESYIFLRLMHIVSFVTCIKHVTFNFCVLNFVAIIWSAWSSGGPQNEFDRRPDWRHRCLFFFPYDFCSLSKRGRAFCHAMG